MSDRLVDLASAIRSKNAGIHRITCDVMFADRAVYERVRDAGVLTTATVARLYGVSEDAVVAVVAHDPGQGIKITLQRALPSGSPGDPDILGCQQHAPLYDVEVPSVPAAGAEVGS
ncbi:MAG: DUF4387 domain-containing protein [Trueperaceae bacterium]|nr:DUF4387 domain-containing protein [Trueperaceae bacterium]